MKRRAMILFLILAIATGSVAGLRLATAQECNHELECNGHDGIPSGRMANHYCYMDDYCSCENGQYYPGWCRVEVCSQCGIPGPARAYMCYGLEETACQVSQSGLCAGAC